MRERPTSPLAPAKVEAASIRTDVPLPLERLFAGRNKPPKGLEASALVLIQRRPAARVKRIASSRQVGVAGGKRGRRRRDASRARTVKRPVVCCASPAATAFRPPPGPGEMAFVYRRVNMGPAARRVTRERRRRNDAAPSAWGRQPHLREKLVGGVQDLLAPLPLALLVALELGHLRLRQWKRGVRGFAVISGDGAPQAACVPRSHPPRGDSPAAACAAPRAGHLGTA